MISYTQEYVRCDERTYFLPHFLNNFYLFEVFSRVMESGSLSSEYGRPILTAADIEDWKGGFLNGSGYPLVLYWRNP